MVFTHSAAWKNSETDLMVNFYHAYSHRGRKLQLSPFTHCPFGFPLPTISKNSLYTLFCPLILDHGVLLKISTSGPKILISNFLFDTSPSPKLSICDNQVLTSSDESPGRTIPIRSRVSQTLVFLISTILPRCHHAGFSSWTIIFRPTQNRIPEYRHFVERQWIGRCSFRHNHGSQWPRKYS